MPSSWTRAPGPVRTSFPLPYGRRVAFSPACKLLLRRLTGEDGQVQLHELVGGPELTTASRGPTSRSRRPMPSDGLAFARTANGC